MIKPTLNSTSFQTLSTDELMSIEGGLSLSGAWDAIKSAASWAAEHVFVDLPNWVIGIKWRF